MPPVLGSFDTMDPHPADEGRAPDAYEGRCPICGAHGRFVRDEQPSRESYCCPACQGSLRYQGQAQVLVDRFARRGARSLADLVQEPEFAALRIWEPGELGPFRRYFRTLRGYEVSSYWTDVAPGSRRGKVRCEDLMDLTYPSSSFDVVVTSDVFEHVRKPSLGFAEVHRVLGAGGAHIFSLPVRWPMPDHTVARVDVSGDEDVLLLEPVYHRIHLVYNDFGLDLLDDLEAIGFSTDVVRFESTDPIAARLLTFCSRKPGRASAPATSRLDRLRAGWRTRVRGGGTSNRR